jgi:methionyl-tRNA synthetase
MKPTITYQDFDQLDLRVGKVLEASAPDWSQTLLELKVDFGQEIGRRTILAGVKNYYTPDELKGNNYLFVVNLAEKKMGPGVSQGMILMVDVEGEPRKFELPDELGPGTLVR